MRTLFSGIPLDQMSVSMTIRGAVLPVLALYIVAAEEQGASTSRSSPGPFRTYLKEFGGPGNTYIYLPAALLRIISTSSPILPKHSEVQFDLDLRLSHGGGRRDGGSELAYIARRRRHRIHPRR